MEILIPTYNRRESLLKNLNELVGFICDEAPRTKIIISDNASTDGTDHSVNEFIRENENVNIRYFKNAKNIGLEENAVKVLSLATEDYIMFLGDDDFLEKGYLAFCESTIHSNPKIGSVIPAKVSLYPDGSLSKKSINPISTHYKSGLSSAIEISHWASQMSGLVLFNPTKLLDGYLASNYKSIYLFIYFFTHNILEYESVLANSYTIKVTTFNKKDWSYNKQGLLDEVFNAYYPFLERVGDKGVSCLIERFVIMHGWRFGIKPTNPFYSLNQLIHVLKSTKNIKGLKRRIVVQFIRTYFYLIRHSR